MCPKHDIVWEKFFREKHIVATITYLSMSKTFEIGLSSPGLVAGLCDIQR